MVKSTVGNKAARDCAHDSSCIQSWESALGRVILTAEGKIRIGISGWRYKPWRGSFYPEGLPQNKELEFASRKLNTIELNGSFYSLQRPTSFSAWYDSTPEDFQFSIKGSRFITHLRRLREIEAPLANFFAQGILRLGEKLGPFLWQFPPSFKFNSELMESFFTQLPRGQEEAAELGRRHEARMEGRTWLDVRKDRQLRHAVEIRNESFVSEDFVALLRKYGIGLVKADTVKWPLLMDVTSDVVYCRLHGSEELYASGYSDEALEMWANRVALWSRGKEVEEGQNASSKKGGKRSTRDVFVYFDNDLKVRAPFDALSLRERVSKLKGDKRSDLK
jgi:uncharacterized protein YecE (DUF72 family)